MQFSLERKLFKAHPKIHPASVSTEKATVGLAADGSVLHMALGPKHEDSCWSFEFAHVHRSFSAQCELGRERYRYGISILVRSSKLNSLISISVHVL